MRTLLFKGTFDPITSVHIRYALQQAKNFHASKIVFKIEEEPSVACIEHRQWMIEKMIRPFRKLSLQLNYCDEMVGEINEGELSAYSEKVRQGDFSLINSACAMIISRYGFYGANLIQKQLKEKRYLHSLSVAQVCKEIAQAHHLNPDKAYLIGIYHDLAKNLDPQSMSDIIQRKKPYEMNYPLPVWHQYGAAYLLTTKYKLRDREMLDAIRHHCLGDDCHPYSMIVFIADKIEPLRGYDSTNELAMAKTDLKKAFVLVHQEMDDYLQKEKHH